MRRSTPSPKGQSECSTRRSTNCWSRPLTRTSDKLLQHLANSKAIAAKYPLLWSKELLTALGITQSICSGLLQLCSVDLIVSLKQRIASLLRSQDQALIPQKRKACPVKSRPSLLRKARGSTLGGTRLTLQALAVIGTCLASASTALMAPCAVHRKTP